MRRRITKEQLLAIKEASIWQKVIGGIGAVAGGGKIAGSLLFFFAPAILGFSGGVIGSKLTSPRKEDFDRMQDDAYAADLENRTDRLRSLPPRQVPKREGREGIWRP